MTKNPEAFKRDGTCRDCGHKQKLSRRTTYFCSSKCSRCGGIVDPNEEFFKKFKNLDNFGGKVIHKAEFRLIRPRS